MPLVQVITSGDYTLGLRADGKVLYTGATGPEEEVTQWENIKQLWYDPIWGVVGITKSGQCISPGRELETIDGIVALACSTTDYKDIGLEWKVDVWTKCRLFGLREDGTVHLLSKLGEGEEIFDRDYESWKDVSAIAGSRGIGIHGVTRDGKVLGYGGEYYAQPVQTLLCHEGAIAALTTDGRVLCNIASIRPIVYQWTNVKKIFLFGHYGEGGIILAQMENGDMELCSASFDNAARGEVIHDLDDIEDFYYAWGNIICKTASGRMAAISLSEYAQWQEYIPLINGLKQISDFSIGYGAREDNYVFAALRTDGSVVAIGSNESGQCDVDSWYPTSDSGAALMTKESEAKQMITYKPSN